MGTPGSARLTIASMELKKSYIAVSPHFDCNDFRPLTRYHSFILSTLFLWWRQLKFTRSTHIETQLNKTCAYSLMVAFLYLIPGPITCCEVGYA